VHVLIVSAWDPTSGVLTVYRSLAKHLGPQGVRFSAFAFDGWSVDTWWTFCDELIDGRTITLADVLMSGRYDLLHCVDTTYSPPYGVETWVRRSRFRGPVVLMAQVARRELTGPAHATRFVACSPAAADILAGDADGPVAVIANGYDEEVFRPGRVDYTGRPFLAWVGRSYDPQKGVNLFLDAVESLPGYDAVLVDADPGGKSIRNRLDRLGPRVRHRSLLEPDQMAEVYRAAAVSGGALVCTSLYEGFPLAIAEAMACGCPIIAPQVAGLDHLVDGCNALLFNRSSGAHGIATALRRLESPDLRADLVAQALRQAGELWTSRTMADSYMRLYEEAVTATPNQPSRRDRAVSAAWHVALSARPAWHRFRRLVGA
jgi:glycosyltransferase involved in cell wall biosynthesis